MLRWLEGFEGVTTSMLTQSRLYETATGALIAEIGANDILHKGVSADDALLRTKQIVTTTQDGWVIGFAFRSDNITSIEGTSAAYVALENGDGEQIRFEFAEDTPASSKPGGIYYKIRAMRGATELASTIQHFNLGDATGSDWIYFEFKTSIHNTTGSIAGRFHYVRKPTRNGAGPTTLTWDAAVTNIDTQNQTSTGADCFVVSLDTGNTSRGVAFDDIYVCDTTGTKNNDYLGKLAIVGQKPLGDGDTIEWELADATSLQDAWDEPSTSTDDDARMTSDVTTQIALGTVDPLTLLGENSSVIGVRQDIIARMETSGDLDIAHMFRKTTGTPAQTNGGAALNVDSTTYVGHSVVLEDDPNTTIDWEYDDLSSYQHGVRNDG